MPVDSSGRSNVDGAYTLSHLRRDDLLAELLLSEGGMANRFDNYTFIFFFS